MSITPIDMNIETQARAHQHSLTKPRGALGRLEDVACWFAARQGKVVPDAIVAHISVFAGDHGVVEAGISAFPSVVTGEMVKNFARGGAAINVLARQCDASLSVVDTGVASDLSDIDGIVHHNIRAGTDNLLHTPAMLISECTDAIAAGKAEAEKAIGKRGANLLIAGDMGIGNTTAAACIICRLTGAAPADVVGFGTGIDAAARKIKIDVVTQALQRVSDVPDSDLLHQLGGLEIAAMTGFYLQAATAGIPLLLDGFISAAAALAARCIEPNITDWMLASHVSRENGHALALQALGLSALVDLHMRLGEGSGAAVVVPLLQSALALHRDMATFESAGVSNKGE